MLLEFLNIKLRIGFGEYRLYGKHFKCQAEIKIFEIKI